MFDPNRNFADGYVDVTPNDAADLDRPLKGLNCSVAGLVKVTTVGDASHPEWTGLLHFCEGDDGKALIKRVWADGKTATIQAGII